MIRNLKFMHACAVPSDIKVPTGVGEVKGKWRCPECRQRWEIRRYAFGCGSSMRVGRRRYLKGFK